jgi:hypothetical protein
VEGWLDGEPIAEENLWIAQEICEQFVAEGISHIEEEGE